MRSRTRVEFFFDVKDEAEALAIIKKMEKLALHPMLKMMVKQQTGAVVTGVVVDPKPVVT